MNLPQAVRSSRVARALLLFCFLASSAALSRAQVISEFAAQNNGLLLDEEGDSPDWIEIHNPTAQAVNLLNWSLTDASTNLTKWLFPATSLPAGGYLVVFASGKDRRIAGTPLHTNFKLDLDGEYLALVAPGGSSIATAFAPTYPPQLPNITYGLKQLSGAVPVLGGTAPARALVPRDGTLGLNWVARDFDDANWMLGSNGVGFETEPADYADLIKTDVRAPMIDQPSCYVRLPFVVPNPGAFTQWQLSVQYDDGFIAYLNGQEIARRNAPDNPQWNSTATANHPDADAVVPEELSLVPVEDLLVMGTNLLAIHGLNTSTSSSDFLIRATIEARPLESTSSTVPVYLTTPTPGAANLGGIEAPGPIIRDPRHAPGVPAAGQNLVINARIEPAFHPVASASVHFRTMFDPESEIPMFDDGAHGDGTAGDGLFGATLPTAGAGPGEMIQYYLTAADSARQGSRAPLYLDRQDSSQYFGTVVANPSIQSALPVVYWFLQNPGGAESQTGTRGAIFYDGEFYDNVLASVHGQSSSGFPKKGFNLDFPRDHRFRYATNSARVKDIKMLTNWADKSKVRNALAYEMIREAGSVGHFAFPVRVEQNGQFHAILDMMEDADDRWMERVGRDPNGALYKVYNSLDGAGGSEKKTRKNEDFSDLQTLVDNLRESRSLPTRVTYAYDNVDLPQTIGYFVGLALVSSQDHGHKNYYVYRDTDGSGEWAIFPWDVDLSWGRNWIDAGGYFTDTLYQNNSLTFYNSSQQGKPSNRLYNLILGHPDFRHMYLRRLRTVMDTVLQSPSTPASELKIEARVKAMLDLMDPPPVSDSDADLDFAKWGSWGNMNRMRPEAQRIIDLHLPGRRTFLFNSGSALVNGEAIPPSQPTNAAIVIGNLDMNPVSGNQAEEFIQLLNPNDYALDLSGWKIQGAVEFVLKPGTVLPPNSPLFLSPNVRAFRARTTAPQGGQGLFVQGDYRGQLSARGEMLELLDQTGRLVARTNYPGNPTRAQQFLKITELMYHPPAPPAGSAFTDEDFEFIELKNSGNEALSLAGLRLTRGVEFAFTNSSVLSLAPGAYLLVVGDAAAFAARYGTGLPVAGSYLGNLENNGETLRLEDGVGEVVFEFDYSPTWQPLTDGLGRSLELIKADFSPGTADHWQASAQSGGSPGTDPAGGLRIRNVALANQELVFLISGEPGQSYAIRHRTDLAKGGWEPLKAVTAPAQSGEFQVQLEISRDGQPHFYQVAVP